MPDPIQHEQLERAADAFLAITDDLGWDKPPLLVRLENGLDPAAGAELGVKQLDGHPAQALLGFSAPIAWTAIGVSAEGLATSCAKADHGYRPDAPADATRERVRSLVLVSRDGLAAGRLRSQDGRVVTEAPAEGLIVDCLRRALGRRTSPPAQTTVTLFATLWLENVLVEAKRGRRQVGWPRVVALHPAVQVLTRGGQSVKPGELVEVAGTLSRVCDWTVVRHQVIAGWRPGGIEAPVAVWMDTGMLSRWLLDRRPTIDQLLDALGASCPPVVLQRIGRSLDRMGLTTALRAPGERRPDVA